MNVSGNKSTSAQITSPDGQPRILVAENVVTQIWPCSADCILPQLLHTTVELIPLGGTRKDIPGVLYEDRLFVTNLFTWSRREWWPVNRSLKIFQEVISRIKAANISNLVNVQSICTCSTSMEFLDGYQLLENSSVYTPQQHRTSCWSDHHSFKEFKKMYDEILNRTAELHHQNIIHTDITGFNILVNEQSDWKLIDLFSCITVESLGPSWIPVMMKRWIGKKIEYAQIKKYLLRPALTRWSGGLHKSPQLT